MKLSMRRTAFLAAVVAATLNTSLGATVVLQDANSSAAISTTTSLGQFDWTVDGQHQLFKQWFWYRVGSTGPEAAINTLTHISDTATDNTLLSQYSGNGFTLSVQYTLQGQAADSGQSDLAESITVTNTVAGSTLDFHLFQYVNFHLGGTTLNTVQFVDDNVVQQSSSNGVVVAETVAVPTPTHRQAGTATDIYGSLTDGSPTTLNDTPAVGADPLGPCDAAWSFQWDKLITVGDPLSVTKDKALAGANNAPAEAAPLPAAAWAGLALLGGMGLQAGLRKRKTR